MAEAPPEAPHAAPVTRSPWRTRLLAGLWLAMAIAYVAASATSHRAIAVAVVGLMAAVLLWSGGRLLLAAMVAAAGLAMAILLPDSTSFMAYLPPMAAFAFMAWFFGRTLKPGTEPLIARVARKEYPDLPQDMARYARALTLLWSLTFLAMFGAALALALLVPFATWARWVHAMGYAVPGGLLVVEYAYRHIRFHDRPHGSPALLIANIVRVVRESALENASHRGIAPKV